MIAEIPLQWGDSYVETESPCPHPVGDVRIPDPMGSPAPVKEETVTVPLLPVRA
jgi:hypothetical protein